MLNIIFALNVLLNTGRNKNKWSETQELFRSLISNTINFLFIPGLRKNPDNLGKTGQMVETSLKNQTMTTYKNSNIWFSTKGLKHKQPNKALGAIMI